MFWLSPRPDAPWAVASPPWNGSGIQRSCAQCTFLDLSSGTKLGIFSTQFDNDADDSLETGGSEARRSSAALVMDRASQLKQAGHADMVVVCGDFNTFEDRAGAAYAALLNGAQGSLVDVRDAPSVLEMDGGRGSSTWEGWEDHAYRRSVAGDQRYDQMFVSSDATVTRTTVFEGRFAVPWNDQYHWVYASDHLPIVTDLLVPVNDWAKKRRRRLVNCCDRLKQARRTMTCVIILSVLAGLLGIVMIYLMCVARALPPRHHRYRSHHPSLPSHHPSLPSPGTAGRLTVPCSPRSWDWVALSYECRLQCRVRAVDPPFDNCGEDGERMLLEWDHN
jgi:hypothetical protein